MAKGGPASVGVAIRERLLHRVPVVAPHPRADVGTGLRTLGDVARAVSKGLRSKPEVTAPTTEPMIAPVRAAASPRSLWGVSRTICVPGASGRRPASGPLCCWVVRMSVEVL